MSIVTREELAGGYYKLNVPKTTERRDREGRVALIFKRAFSVPTRDLVRSISREARDVKSDVQR